jgi:hypothetical protein
VVAEIFAFQREIVTCEKSGKSEAGKVVGILVSDGEKNDR